MKRIILNLLILIVLSSSVLGFGVTDWLSGPVKVAPGSGKEVKLELQNMVGDEDVIIKAVIDEGADIATINEGNEIMVPFGVKKKIYVRINIPENYVEGDYPIKIRFVGAPSGKSDGPVQIGTGITKQISVNVNSGVDVEELPPLESPSEVEKLGTGSLSSILIMLAILILIIIIVKFIHKKR